MMSNTLLIGLKVYQQITRYFPCFAENQVRSLKQADIVRSLEERYKATRATPYDANPIGHFRPARSRIVITPTEGTGHRTFVR